jgi:hypothetical protein
MRDEIMARQTLPTIWNTVLEQTALLLLLGIKIGLDYDIDIKL